MHKLIIDYSSEERDDRVVLYGNYDDLCLTCGFYAAVTLNINGAKICRQVEELGYGAYQLNGKMLIFEITKEK